MSPTPRPSIRSGSSQNVGLLNRPIRRWLVREFRSLLPAVAASARTCKADHYRKHFAATTHAALLVYHGLSGSRSVTESYHRFAACSDLAQRCGFLASDGERVTVSRAQFLGSNTSRPASFLGLLLPPFVARVRQLAPHTTLPRDLRAHDGTFFPLSRLLAPWLHAKQRRVGLQLTYDPARDLPEHLLIAKQHINDYVAMRRAILEDPTYLESLAGLTLLFDLGYYSHHAFATLLDAGVHLITRLHPQARYAVLEDRPLQPALVAEGTARITVTADQRIVLGSPNNRRTPRLLPMRVVTATVAPTNTAQRRQGSRQETHCYQILTDRWDLSATEVVQCYLWRWTIERLFWWLKRCLGTLHLLGYSENAVELSIYLGLLVHLLSVLLAHALNQPRSQTLLGQLVVALAQLTSDDWPPPDPIPVSLFDPPP